MQYPYKYYRLCESYRDEKGRACRRMVLGLGELTELPSEKDHAELAELLTLMIEKGECLFTENKAVYNKALDVYNTYKTSQRAVILQEADKYLEEEAQKKRKSANRVLFPYG